MPPIDEGLLDTMFSESFGDRSRSPCGVALSALLTKVDLICQTLTSPMRQEYSSRHATRSNGYASRKSVYVNYSWTNKNKKNEDLNEIVCRNCNKMGQYQVIDSSNGMTDTTRRARAELIALVVHVNSTTLAVR